MGTLLQVLVTLSYLAGYFPTARHLYVVFDEKEKPESSERNVIMGWAAVIATLWPIVVIGAAFKRFLFRETPRQAKARLDAELAATRREAARFDLPMPTEMEISSKNREWARWSGRHPCSRCVRSSHFCCPAHPHGPYDWT